MRRGGTQSFGTSQVPMMRKEDIDVTTHAASLSRQSVTPTVLP